MKSKKLLAKMGTVYWIKELQPLLPADTETNETKYSRVG